eukprot:scaffold39397_cov60-Phaeocystis_antarctica.AAC.1
MEEAAAARRHAAVPTRRGPKEAVADGVLLGALGLACPRVGGHQGVLALEAGPLLRAALHIAEDRVLRLGRGSCEGTRWLRGRTRKLHTGR